ncbi:MAG: hypothetical protein ACK5MT_02375 [Actinomycetales bacterium]
MRGGRVLVIAGLLAVLALLSPVVAGSVWQRLSVPSDPGAVVDGPLRLSPTAGLGGDTTPATVSDPATAIDPSTPVEPSTEPAGTSSARSSSAGSGQAPVVVQPTKAHEVDDHPTSSSDDSDDEQDD